MHLLIKKVKRKDDVRANALALPKTFSAGSSTSWQRSEGRTGFERSANADAVYHRLVKEPEAFAVPELFCYEVFATLFRVHPRAQETFEQGILPLLRSGLLRYPMTDAVASRAARFVRAGLTGCDACYAALAEELDAVWLTFDSRAHARILAEGISADMTSGLPAGW